MSATSASLTPHYLVASDPESLRVLCIKLNAVTGDFHTFNIVHANKKWYAWFLFDALTPLPELGD
jgi:hypothetical protein